ncbi:thioesterase [Alginatibacterium sediminis]|uniref:Thioesterase n=1 Tax=Alginatibacterium sediminis TaxID=2164068 RepID=A0A420EI84_9ALTE|nr:acyl-CoA thioesterase [Alginatibacterium sediminis]RKF20429.1 thioesterase [Alginatibacterium sediminis]
MYPFLRLAKTMFLANKKSKICYTEPSQINFICHPWDIDLFGEMNNGRILTLYDLGRTDLGLRCDLMTLLSKNKWALVVAGSSVRYRKRVKMFDKITMHSQCVGYDDKWLYIEQSMWVKGQPCSSVLVRAGVTSKQGIIPPARVEKDLGLEPQNTPLPAWVTEWIASEQHRPWPPTQHH